MFAVVYAEGSRDPYIVVLLCKRFVWCIFWSPRGRNRKDGWGWWLRRMEVDLLARGITNSNPGGAVLFLPNSPKVSGKWLDNDEIRYLELQYFIKEGGKFKEEQKKTSWRDIRAVMLNWRMYLLAYILLCQSACSYSLSTIFYQTRCKADGF